MKTLEDARLYRLFQAAIISDYAPLSAVDHELVLRLTSLLWRLRRATAVESGLLEIQATIVSGDKNAEEGATAPSSDLYRLLGFTSSTSQGAATARADERANGQTHLSSVRNRNNSRDVAECYLRLANITNGFLERFGRYEARLWRQARQIIAMLETMRGSLSKGSTRSFGNAITLRDDFDGRPPNRPW